MREHFDRFDRYVDMALRSIIETDLGLSTISDTDLQTLRNRMAAEHLLDQVDQDDDHHGPEVWTTLDDPTGATLRHAWIMEAVLPRLRGLPLHLGGLIVWYVMVGLRRRLSRKMILYCNTKRCDTFDTKPSQIGTHPIRHGGTATRRWPTLH